MRAPLVGIVVNPSSGRDIRRLLSRASVVPTSEKIQIVLRLLAGLGAATPAEALLMPDPAGVAATIRREAAASASPLPPVHALDLPVEGTADDTRLAVAQMVERGVRAIVVLGGDGTHRVVAAAAGETPLLALSTGTNNAFPEMREATTAGLALGLYLAGRVPDAVALRRNKRLRVRHQGRDEIALVDVCVAGQPFLGARAVWEPGDLRRLFVAFADRRNIGLTAIAAWAAPTTREEPWGLDVQFGSGGNTVLAPIAPGLVRRIALRSAERLLPGTPVVFEPNQGTLALDGERELELVPGATVVVALELDGPLTLDIDAILAHVAHS